MKKINYLISACFVLFLLLGTYSCNSNGDSLDSELEQNENPTGTLTVTDLTLTISANENPTSGATLEKISASTTAGTVKYVLKSSTPVGAIKIGTDGSIMVDDNALFDYETNPKITAIATVSDDEESKDVAITVNIKDVDETSVDLDANSIVSVDNDDFNIEVVKVSIDEITADDLVTKVYDLRFSINNNAPGDNHVPLIMTVGQLPRESTTLVQSETKDSYNLKASEFKIKYVRRQDNLYAYGLRDAAPEHDLHVVVNDGIVTFNISKIELSQSSVFDMNRKKFNISFSIALSDIIKHEGITVAKSYSLAK